MRNSPACVDVLWSKLDWRETHARAAKVCRKTRRTRRASSKKPNAMRAHKVHHVRTSSMAANPFRLYSSGSFDINSS